MDSINSQDDHLASDKMYASNFVHGRNKINNKPNKTQNGLAQFYSG